MTEQQVKDAAMLLHVLSQIRHGEENLAAAPQVGGLRGLEFTVEGWGEILPVARANVEEKLRVLGVTL